MKNLIACVSFLLFLSIPVLHAQTKNLSYYIDQSIENSPLLKDYQNQTIINRIDSLILNAAYKKPSLDFLSNNFFSPIVSGYGYDEAITHKGRNSALLTIRQTIIGQGNLKTGLNSYKLENQLLHNEKKIYEQDLKLVVTTQYIATYGILEEIQFNEELENLLKKEEVLLKKLTESSVYKLTDYLNFQVTMQQHQLFMNQQRAEYKNNLAVLNYLCGIVDTSFVLLNKPDVLLQNSLTFENTLQYNNFQIDSMIIQNKDALIDFSYRPKLDLYADAGFNSTLSNYTYKHFGASIGFSLAIPIYERGQRQQEHNKLKITEQTRKNYQDFSRLQYRQQLDLLYQQLNETERLINQAQTIIKSTQTLMSAYAIQLQTGDAAVTDYILSVNNYMNALHVITQHANQKLQIINQINYWNHE